ncbi:FHA domain-containing protein [Vitiosangium sp. GDMCC 1.1324]|uniref:FHA domain-containing protein n=1 Tax=Vitiosangium sp. (strain GDMCC 1.1324) TaxID=2138576 RepID=UPI001E3B481F|nr:FHA domain-containing protein [Vitiosangium sp. GDMCC 1.1324]
MQQGKELLFEQDEISIGRTTDNDVVLQDGGVSRKHVRILDRLGRYFVQDMGSSNGTLINDSPLSGEHELRNGDRISLGPVEFVFKEIADPDGATQLELPTVQEDDDVTRPIRRNTHALSRAETDDEMVAPMSESSPVGPEPSGPPVLHPVPEGKSRAVLSRAETVGEMEVVVPPPAAPPSRRETYAPVAPRPELRAPVAPARPEPRAPEAPSLSEQNTAVVLRPEPRAPEVPSEPEQNTAVVARPELRAPEALSQPEQNTAVVPRPESRVPARVGSASAARASREASGGLSAADKARRRRELSDTLGGQLSLWWLELPRGGKGALLTVAVCFLVGMVGALAVAFRPQLEAGSRGPEPRSLGLQVLPDSFGLGEGVTWPQPDMKAFDFEFVSPTRAVAVLRFQASGISKEEVSLTVNAVNVGWVPPDTTNSSEREIQQILSPSVLKRNELNQIVFDNVRNPPGEDSWRVWNLRLEVIPVPDLRPEELLEAARGYVARARNFYERRDVGSENLSLAWENYRSAWITLEALDDKPDLYQDVRFMLGQVAADLDLKCGQLMLDFQRNIQFKERKRAAQVLDEINRRFPTAAHRCHNLAAEKASEYGL